MRLTDFPDIERLRREREARLEAMELVAQLWATATVFVTVVVVGALLWILITP